MNRYGSGRTTRVQVLTIQQNLERDLCITYTQTSTRDIIRNLWKLDFKRYRDNYPDADLWKRPKLIVQIDNLVNILLNSAYDVTGGPFDLSLEFLMIDDSEIILSHVDDMTMNEEDMENVPLYRDHKSLTTSCCYVRQS